MTAAASNPMSADSPGNMPGVLKIIDAPGGFGLDDLTPFPNTVSGQEEGALSLSLSLPPEPEPGQRVGRYLTEAILGRGGMGLVLRARDDLLQRLVAVKVILPRYLLADPAAGLRFLREAEIVARLQHPHIIRVLDAGLDAGIAYLTFEYVSGKSYADVRDEKIEDPTKIVDLILPVISAVACAHRLGVVHGDLKPTNLILGQDYSGRQHPWVLDFGVSFFSGVDAGLDPTRQCITGTPGYIAPEWLDNARVDGRADCFSLGCVLYELLAGRGPFNGLLRLSQTVDAARERAYPRLSQLRELPSGLEAAIYQALEPRPSERFSCAEEMGAALLSYASIEFRAHYAREFEGSANG